MIVGAGYIGLEMADALVVRGLSVSPSSSNSRRCCRPSTSSSARSSTAELEHHGVDVHCRTTVRAIRRNTPGALGALTVEATASDGSSTTRSADVVIVVVGVRPDTDLAATAGAELGPKGAIAVDRRMRTSLPDVWAAGDCAATYHRLSGLGYLPLGTTAHKQGRIAGENALGGEREFAGSLGTQVVKIFDHLVAAQAAFETMRRSRPDIIRSPWAPRRTTTRPYYPGSHRISMRYTGDRDTGRLLGAQLVGHRDGEVAKRIDIVATALFHEMTLESFADLDLSYTPPLGSPWDAVQIGAQAWERESSPRVTETSGT